MKIKYKKILIIFALLIGFSSYRLEVDAYSVPTFIVYETTYCNLGVNIIYRTVNRNGYYYGGYLQCGKGCACKGTLTLIDNPYQ